MRTAKKAQLVAEDAAAMGYRLTRENKLFGKYWLWSSDDYPIITGDLTFVMRFLITDPEMRMQMEQEAKRSGGESFTAR